MGLFSRKKKLSKEEKETLEKAEEELKIIFRISGIGLMIFGVLTILVVYENLIFTSC